MNIVKLPSQFNICETYFSDSLYNATNNSVFSRIVMCESTVNSAGLYLRLNLFGVVMGRRFRSATAGSSLSDSSVQYCTDYNTEKNFAIIASIQQIEHDILRLYQRTIKPVNKTPCCHIFDTVLCGRLKICTNIGTSFGNLGSTIQIQDAGDDDETESDEFVVIGDETGDADRSVCESVCSNECRKLTHPQHHQKQPQQPQQPQTTIVLKISGVWESEATFGLTFKFITLTPC